MYLSIEACCSLITTVLFYFIVEIVNMDITSLEIECKAECIPLQVVVQPYAIFVNGKNLVGTTVRRHFTVRFRNLFARL